MTANSAAQETTLRFLFLTLPILTSCCISRVCCYKQKLDMAVLMNFNAYIEHIYLLAREEQQYFYYLKLFKE